MVKDDHDGDSGDGSDKEDEEAGEDEGQVEEENDREQAGVDKDDERARERARGGDDQHGWAKSLGIASRGRRAKA